MLCNSCWNTIIEGQITVNCETCEKEIHRDCAIIDSGTFCDVCYTVNSSKQGLKTLQVEIPEVIRRSYIQTYKNCPFQFYKEVIEGVEVPIGIHAQVGIDFHELAEKASKREIYSPIGLLEYYRETFNNYPDELFERGLILYKDMTIEGLKDKLYQQIVASAHNLYDVVSKLPTEPYMLEENIQFSVGEDLPKVSITMDRVDLVDGELEIIDWKTGTVMVGQNLSSDLQAPLYINAVKSHTGLPVRKFTFHYLGENKERTFIRDNVIEDLYICTVGKRDYHINLIDNIKEVQHIFSQIKNKNFNIPLDTSKMYFTCKVCGVKQSGKCQGADTQSWIQFNK